MAWYRQLHWQILIGMALGALYGVFAAQQGWGGFTSDWIAPIGKIFVNLLNKVRSYAHMLFDQQGEGHYL